MSDADPPMEAMMLLTVEDVAERLRVSKKTVYGWLRSGELRSIRLGGLWRISEEDLAQFIEEHK